MSEIRSNMPKKGFHCFDRKLLRQSFWIKIPKKPFLCISPRGKDDSCLGFEFKPLIFDKCHYKPYLDKFMILVNSSFPIENSVIRSAKTSNVDLSLFCYLKYFQLTSKLVTKTKNSKFKKISAPSLYMRKKWNCMKKFWRYVWLFC